MNKFSKLFCLIGILFIFSNSVQGQEFDGYALYNSFNSNTTYLIDKNGDIANTWSLTRPCNYTVQLMENGNIMRGAVNQSNQINGPAVGGLIQEIDPDGNVVWEFVYSTTDHVSHHDISLMPDGNVLLTAWEVKNSTQLDSMGYTGTSNIRFPTQFIEVSQNGTGGEIVWEWHLWDHLVQDVDPNKPNYGVVAEHPELMNINVPSSGFGGPNNGDWFHINGVDYNPELDQIVFSSRFLNEVFIIDHSTTTVEAAGHTGGNSGKGGDLLYRWGNPSNFGASGVQTILGPVHDARWIPDDGRPRGGFIQFFNNDGDGISSTVDALELPFASDGYNYEWTAGQAYEPTGATWRHTCLDNADGQSASNSMPNGNTYVNLSGSYMYEVDVDGNLIWQYNSNSPKGFRYVCDHPGVQTLIAQEVIEDLCEIIDATNEIPKESVQISPNPSKGIFNIDVPIQGYQVANIQVFNLLGDKIQDFENDSTIDLSNSPSGIYFIAIRFDNGQLIANKVSIVQ